MTKMLILWLMILSDSLFANGSDTVFVVAPDQGNDRLFSSSVSDSKFTSVGELQAKGVLSDRPDPTKPGGH